MKVSQIDSAYSPRPRYEGADYLEYKIERAFQSDNGAGGPPVEQLVSLQPESEYQTEWRETGF